MPAIEGAQRPFWMHQIVEYLIGLVLIAASFQAPKPMVPAVMGMPVSYTHLTLPTTPYV